MVTNRLKSILVGDVSHLEFLSVRRRPADRSGDSDSLMVGAGVLQKGLLLAHDTVARLIAFNEIPR